MARIVLVSGTVFAALASAGAARAEDWRGSGVPQHDRAFVDADTIVRRADGNIGFRAHLRLREAGSISARGYDQIDLEIVAQCPVSSSADPTGVRIGQRYLLNGRRVARPRLASEPVRQDVGSMVASICRGQIGERGFSRIEAALESGEGRYVPFLAMDRFLSAEVELTGTVIQGFEVNTINLCGSEAGCTDDAPEEICWLRSDIVVPVPVNGGSEDWSVRRAADYSFRGRIERSATGDGFGHMYSYGCQVTVVGPVLGTTITQRRPDDPNANSPGGRPAAVTAHTGLSEAIAGSAPVRISHGAERTWSIIGLDSSLGAYGRGNACHSHVKLETPAFDSGAPTIEWTQNAGVSRRGATVTVATAGSDEALSFASATPVSARHLQSMLSMAVSHPIRAVEQEGRRVTIQFERGARETITFENAGLATEAVGVAQRLRGIEIAAVGGRSNRYWARPVRRVHLTFGDEGRAAEALRLMEALRVACAASPGA